MYVRASLYVYVCVCTYVCTCVCLCVVPLCVRTTRYVCIHVHTYVFV